MLWDEGHDSGRSAAEQAPTLQDLRVSRTLRAVALTCLTVVAVALPVTANAERSVVQDPKRDVTGTQYVPDPPPCGSSVDVDASANTNQDITSLRVRHSRTYIALRARFRDLDVGLEQMTTFHLASEKSAWMLSIYRLQKRDGTFRMLTFLGKTPKEPDELGPDECGYMIGIMGISCRTSPQVDHDADVVSATIPRRCLGNPRWVRAGVETYGAARSEEDVATYFFDQWGSEEDRHSLIVSPLGDRVRAPRGADLRRIVGPAGTMERTIGLVGGPGYRWVRQ